MSTLEKLKKFVAIFKTFQNLILQTYTDSLVRFIFKKILKYILIKMLLKTFIWEKFNFVFSEILFSILHFTCQTFCLWQTERQFIKKEKRFQFHQHFTRAFLAPKFRTKNARVKCWWNWLKDTFKPSFSQTWRYVSTFHFIFTHVFFHRSVYF